MWAVLRILENPVVWRQKIRLWSKPPSVHEETGSEEEGYGCKFT